jgi:acetyl esterase/lipase
MIRWFLVGVLLLALVASCSDGDEGSASATTAAPVTTTITSTTVPATTAPSTTVVIDRLEVDQVKELPYLSDDEGEWTLDVFYPTEEGPWPLVVVFPGACDNCAAITLARTLAQRGAVVAAPRYWHGPGSSTATDYLIGNIHNDRAACAVGYAQAIATDYAGRADQTTVVGFSAGVHPAGWVGLGVADDEMCEEQITHPPVGLVVGDSQFIFQDTLWDDAFQNETLGAADTVDRFINPARWNVPDNLSVFLWSTESGGTSRPIEDPPEPDSWVWSRDTTGTLVEDLGAVGALDTGRVGFFGNGLLLEQRMLDAGIDVTHVQYPGGHNYNLEVYDRIMEVVTGGSK